MRRVHLFHWLLTRSAPLHNASRKLEHEIGQVKFSLTFLDVS